MKKLMKLNKNQKTAVVVSLAATATLLATHNPFGGYETERTVSRAPSMEWIETQTGCGEKEKLEYQDAGIHIDALSQSKDPKHIAKREKYIKRWSELGNNCFTETTKQTTMKYSFIEWRSLSAFNEAVETIQSFLVALGGIITWGATLTYALRSHEEKIQP
jgi:hypothetical protein